MTMIMKNKGQEQSGVENKGRKKTAGTRKISSAAKFGSFRLRLSPSCCLLAKSPTDKNRAIKHLNIFEKQILVEQNNCERFERKFRRGRCPQPSPPGTDSVSEALQENVENAGRTASDKLRETSNTKYQHEMWLLWAVQTLSHKTFVVS